MGESTMRSVNKAAQQEFVLIDPSLKFENSRAGTRLNVEHTGIRIPNANLQASSSDRNLGDLTKMIRQGSDLQTCNDSDSSDMFEPDSD